MLQTKKINPKDRTSPVAVSYDPTEILIRNAGKENYGKEEKLAVIKNGALHIYKNVAVKFGLTIEILDNEEKPLDDSTIVGVIRNYRGQYEINYLMTLGDFKKEFASFNRTDFFSSHDRALDWEIFTEDLQNAPWASWATANNDTMDVCLLNNKLELESFLSGIFNEDPVEMITNNRSDSIVEDIETRTDWYWYLDLAMSSVAAVKWAHSLCPELVNTTEHGKSFIEAFNELKSDLTPEEVKECEEYIRQHAKVAS